MKKEINMLKYGLLIALFSFSFSCNEKELLKEDPLDFFSIDNSYNSLNDFETALTGLYARVREINFGGGDVNTNMAYFLATDIAKNARGNTDHFGDYSVWLVPTNSMVKHHWVEWYKVISDANTIISRLKDSNLPDEQKKLVGAEAKFFRAFAYRYLVYIYGGVPLVLNEISSPKTDFVRASKDDVLTQMIKDLKYAATDLPTINKVEDGKVSNLVALHYLAETYISLHQYDSAIAAVTRVIDDPNTSLMTKRFGTRADEPGDVYWDLFRRENQNRSSGNREALWVIQMEVDIPGGFIQSSGGGNNQLERYADPVAWLTFLDPDGNSGVTGEPYSNYNSGGRGVSFMMNTNYFLETIWKDDPGDIRNSSFNIVRDFKYNNPDSRWYDSSSVKYPSPTWEKQHWRWYPYPTKTTTPGNHPDALYKDKSKLILKSSAGTTYRDMYILRLAATYLLRAEAYFDKGDKINAARDINVVRKRSHAVPVNPEDVTPDYILDERARELTYEEPRRITLSRTGTLVERVRKYNSLNADDIQDYNNIWPIPFSEIEANKDAAIKQNPGYN